MPEDSQHGVVEVLVGQPRQSERVGRFVGVRVVHNDLFDSDVGGLGNLQAEAGLHHAVVAVGAEHNRLAVTDV